MPFSALGFYLMAEFEHETVRDSYFADMALYAAAGNLKEPEQIPRYTDVLLGRASRQLVRPSKQAGVKADLQSASMSVTNLPSASMSVDDVIGMFANKKIQTSKSTSPN